METNTCDKCKVEMETMDLVWLSSEVDFTPKDDEYVPDEVFNKYDALCENCYISVIKLTK